MTWTWEFYTNPRGKSPVQEFFESRPDYVQAHFLGFLEIHIEPQPRGLIGKGGPFHLVDGHWQLRSYNCRFFGLEHPTRRQHLIFFHAFEKKSKETPKNELVTAEKKRKTIIKELEQVTG
ncbi:MAG: type II toxin-antitoxin system RelE/ParE family toxin [Cyanobacteria bacterium REEB67]|nr:type II toxin-antitoxin system RelE/ParE family toxin [Cyanobacteria bacterium REEB67]